MKSFAILMIEACRLLTCDPRLNPREMDLTQAQCQEQFVYCEERQNKLPGAHLISDEAKFKACVKQRPFQTRVDNLKRDSDKIAAEIKARKSPETRAYSEKTTISAEAK